MTLLEKERVMSYYMISSIDNTISKSKYVQVVPTKEKRGPVMGWGQLTKVSLVAKPIKKKKQQ